MRRLPHFSVIAAAMAASILTGCAAPGYSSQVPPPGYGNPAYYPPAAAAYAPGYRAQPPARYAYGFEPQAYRQPYAPAPTRDYQSNRAASSGAIGAVAGGLIGSSVGQGNGRVAASALGAVAGYQSGRSLADPCAPGASAGGMVGAVAGGLLGGSIGQGNGRAAAAALGAVAGYATGSQMSAPRAPRC